jgi:hypothetical protein
MNSPERGAMRFARFAIGKMTPFRLRSLTTEAGLML